MHCHNRCSRIQIGPCKKSVTFLRRGIPLWTGILLCLLMTGCVSDVYRYGVEPATLSDLPLNNDSTPTIRVGGVQPDVDRIERFVQAPRRWARKTFRNQEWNPEAENEQREAAVQVATKYIVENGLDDINIDVRLYDPGLQWHRLKSNQQIHPIWKYTGGAAGWLRYTLLPMRAFHTDHYDPYTNTLHVNSARPLQSLFESASAKEFRRFRSLGGLPIGTGTYAMLQNVPFAPLLHNARAGSDILTYAERSLDDETESELYPLVYSRLGATAVSETLSVVTLAPDAPFYTAPLLRVAGGVSGRMTGKAAALGKRGQRKRP